MKNLKNNCFCGTISDEREKLLDEAFSLLMRMDEKQIIEFLRAIEEDSENAS